MFQERDQTTAKWNPLCHEQVNLINSSLIARLKAKADEYPVNPYGCGWDNGVPLDLTAPTASDASPEAALIHDTRTLIAECVHRLAGFYPFDLYFKDAAFVVPAPQPSSVRLVRLAMGAKLNPPHAGTAVAPGATNRIDLNTHSQAHQKIHMMIPLSAYEGNDVFFPFFDPNLQEWKDVSPTITNARADWTGITLSWPAWRLCRFSPVEDGEAYLLLVTLYGPRFQ